MVIHEALLTEEIREKGVKFNKVKNLDMNDKGMREYKRNEIYRKGRKRENQEVSATTSTGKDINDSKMKSRIESFDQERAKLILESNDIVKEYNEWIDFDIDRIMDNAKNHKADIEAGGAIEFGIEQEIRIMINKYHIKEDKVREYIKGTYFYQTDNPENIKLLLKLRIKYCQKITNMLVDMLQKNSKLLGLYDFEASRIIRDIQSDDNYDVRRGMKKLRNEIIYNSHLFVKDNGCLIDLSQLGFGKIILTPRTDIVSYVTKLKMLKRGYEEEDISNRHQAFDELLQKAMEYDIVINCHGSSRKGGINYRNKELLDKSNQTYSDVKRWTCQAIKAPGGGFFDDVNSLVRFLIKSGYKKIMICSCNPGHHKLADDIQQAKGVIVNHSDWSNLIESSNAIDSLYDGIVEGESQLIELAESCGYSYDEIVNQDPYELLTESFVDTLKEYAKKVVKFILSLFSKLWEFLKKVFGYIKGLFTKNKEQNKTKLEEPLKLSFIVTENAKVQETQADDRAQIEQAALKSCQAIQKEIQKRQQEQTNATKRLQQFVENN